MGKLRDAAGLPLTSERIAAARRRAGDAEDVVGVLTSTCDRLRGDATSFYRRRGCLWLVCAFCGMPQEDHAERRVMRRERLGRYMRKARRVTAGVS